MKTQRLGRGLDALIDSSGREDLLQEIPVDKILPNPYQPRKDFDDEKIEELTQSIMEFGMIQPLTVRRLEKEEGTVYQLAVGERRWRAAKRAQLEMVPAIVQEMDEEKMMGMAVVENLQREDLNPIEEAQAYQKMMEAFGLTQENVANKIGKSRSAVANILRLLKLSPFVQENVSRETISKGHARALLALKDYSDQDLVLRRIVQDDLSVRQTEILVRQFNEPAVGKETVPGRYLSYEKKFHETLGTRVQIHEGKKGNRLIISFQKEEDLKELLNRLRDS